MAPKRKVAGKAAGRKPYRAPALVDYGSIPARTLSIASAGSLVDFMLVKAAKKF